MSDNDAPSDLSAVPLFPLPNVVLFPRAILPLHIFEERYKAMTADALAGDRQVAMALLKTGWERDYYGRPPIEPVVCVGRILSHEKLADGNYNFLLQGQTRARIGRETRGGDDVPYRVAELAPIEETRVLEIDLDAQRQRLRELFEELSYLRDSGIGRQFRQMLTSPLPTADVADLIAFNLLEDVPLKQSLLADGDVVRRVDRVVRALESQRPALAASSTAGGRAVNLN
jgi:Lon protease-like protein